MSQVSGYVGFVKKGPKAWSVKVGDDWFVYGRNKPSFDKGDNVSFEYTLGGSDGTMKIVDTETVKKLAANTKSSGSHGTASRDQYWENKEKRDILKEKRDAITQKVIQYQAARNSAITVTKAAAELGLLKLPKTGDKAYDAFVAAIDSLADEYYDSVQFRFYGEDDTSEGTRAEPVESVGADEDE